MQKNSTDRALWCALAGPMSSYRLNRADEDDNIIVL